VSTSILLLGSGPVPGERQPSLVPLQAQSPASPRAGLSVNPCEGHDGAGARLGEGGRLLKQESSEGQGSEGWQGAVLGEHFLMGRVREYN